MECPHLNYHTIRVPNILEPFSCSVCHSVESPWLCLHCGIVHCGRYVQAHAQNHFQQKKHPLAIDCYSLATFCYECDDFISNQHRIPSLIFERLNAVGGRDSSLDPSVADDDESSNSSVSTSATDDSLVLTSNGAILTVVPAKASTRRRRRRKRGILGSGRGGNRSRGTKTIKEDPTTILPPPPLALGTSRTGRKRSAVLVDYDSGISSENSNSDLSSGHGHNLLLDPLDPKKRRLVIHDDSSSPPPVSRLHHSMRRAKENVSLGIGGDKTGGGKHGVVGLRNLGNTCFMNAVLQSLSKIRGFSCYMVHIPPPDELLGNNDTSPSRRIYSTRSRKNRLLASSQNALNTFGGGDGTEEGLDVLGRKEAMEILRTEELLTNELRKILILLNTKGSSAVSPDSLFSIIWEVMPRFRGYQQQDAHEFLRYMLDQLHNELIRLIPTFSWNGPNTKNGKSTTPQQAQGEVYFKALGAKSLKSGHLSETFMSVFGYNSIVTSMFGGILENEVRCSRCGKESRKNDPFLDLSLDIPMGHGGEARLEDCLSNFTDVEELSDDDKYFCSHCKTLQKSTKRFSIQRLPNVLCLHLKRFRWSNYLRTKLDHFVQFPMTSLDMSEYLLEKLQTRGSSSSHMYDLAAVIVHHGTGVGSGHYTAFAKKDGQWYHFNDSAVKPSEESSVAKCKAYILFYTRSEFKL